MSKEFDKSRNNMYNKGEDYFVPDIPAQGFDDVEYELQGNIIVFKPSKARRDMWNDQLNEIRLKQVEKEYQELIEMSESDA